MDDWLGRAAPDLEAIDRLAATRRGEGGAVLADMLDRLGSDARFGQAVGEDASKFSLVAGVRVWF